MKIRFNYGSEVLNLPADLINLLARADADALRILIALAAGVRDRAALCETCGCRESALDVALAFWSGSGLITTDDAPVPAAPRKGKRTAAPKAATPPAAREDASPEVTVRNSATTLPAYTTEELTAVLERREEMTELIDECSRVFGKIFNTHEVSQLIGLIDYLGLEGEYLLLLLAHCRRIGKRSLRYAVSTAVSLYDEGVIDTSTLQLVLKSREERLEVEGQLRSMFGISTRALTAKEKKAFDAWITQHGFSIDVIRMAYERTVTATGKPSVAYANSILQRWATEQLHTPEQIEQAEQEYASRNQPSAAAPGSSFDTDDFFAAALRRSYGEDYTPADAAAQAKGDAT